jgi:hypothetical protein
MQTGSFVMMGTRVQELAFIPVILLSFNCGLVPPTSNPLVVFPARVSGEIDTHLPAVKAAFESDYSKAKVLRIESGQRAWDIQHSAAGVAVSRVALVHVGFQWENGKCYYQPWDVVQEAGATGWGAIKMGQWRKAFSKKRQSLAGRKGSAWGFSRDSLPADYTGKLVMDAYHIDCGVMSQTGAVFHRCDTQPLDVCEPHDPE